MKNKPTIHEVFIYLRVSDPEAAIEFYGDIFGAEEIFRLTSPEGEIAHAEIKVGPAILMLSGEYPELDIRSPKFYGGSGTAIHLHIDDVDSLAENIRATGSEILMEPKDQLHGERQCRFRDPFGHEWLLGHEIEKLTPEEMQKRIDEE